MHNQINDKISPNIQGVSLLRYKTLEDDSLGRFTKKQILMNIFLGLLQFRDTER